MIVQQQSRLFPKNPRWSSLSVITIVVVALAFAACGKSSTTATGSTGTLTFGIPISLTGATAKEGQLALEGYQLWAKQVNSHGGIKVGTTTYQVALKYYDDGSDPNKSKQLTQQLITSDKANFLLGPYGTAATLQDEAIAEQNSIPMVEANGTANAIFTKGFKYIFGIGSLASEYAKIMIKAALAQPNPPKNVGIIFADDSFSQEIAVAAKEYAASVSLPVTYYQKYPSNATDLTSVMTGLKTSANGAVPEFILGSGHTNEAITTVKTARQLGINPKLYGFTVGPATPDFVSALGKDANDIIGSAQWTAEVKYQGADVFGTSANYLALYKQEFSHAPSYQSAGASASGIAFQYAIQAAQSIDPVKVRDALAALDVTTFYGQLKFGPQGANLYKPMATIQIQQGNLVTVYPTAIANGTMTFPTPPFDSR